MTLTGWIIYNGSLSGGKFRDFAEWLERAATRKGIQTKIYQNNELLASIGGCQPSLLNRTILPHFVLFIDKDTYLAKQLELLGVRVFNSADTIEISDDKIATYHVLTSYHLPIPRTIIAPKIFPGAVTPNIGNIDTIIDQLGLPMIIKEAYGSFGEQVYLIQDKQEMIDKIKEIAGRPFVFQEFIKTSSGKDIRLHVVGDTVKAAMLRHTEKDFRANITTGGSMQAYHPSHEERRIAIAAANAVGADFAGVDLLFGPNEEPIICEINSNAHIRNMYDATGINVANDMLNYVLKTMVPNGEIPS